MYLLTEREADPNIADNNGDTCLHIACNSVNRTHMVAPLINHGADVNVVNTDGDTALHVATTKGNTEAIQLLVNHGADVNVLNKAARSAA